MNNNLLRPLLFLLTIAFFLPSCATTQLNAVWKNPAYNDQPKKIMVISLLPTAANKRIFEEEMVRSLKQRGTDAITSYALLPEQPDRAAVEKAMREQGADAVLIARLMDKKTVTSYVPAAPAPMAGYGSPGYYGAQWHGYYAYNAGTVRQDEFAVLQTNLYDLKTANLVWTASSDTWMAEDPTSLILSFVEIIANSLAKDKVIAPGKRN